MRRTLLIVGLGVVVLGLATIAIIRVSLRTTNSSIPATSHPAPQTAIGVPLNQHAWPYDVQCKDLIRNADGSLTFNGAPDDNPTMQGFTIKSGTEFSIWNEKCLNIKRIAG